MIKTWLLYTASGGYRNLKRIDVLKKWIRLQFSIYTDKRVD
jgi:hypothetical protein